MRLFRWLFILSGLFLATILFGWLYTTLQLNIARSKGVYPSAEQGMRSLMNKGFTDINKMNILYAGTNSFDGSNPYIWYVIAEVHATSRTDGSTLGYQGCDAPGLFFLQTKEGWVQVSEGAFPEFLGFWMKVFSMAGPGQPTPSTDWAPSQPSRFCQRGSSVITPTD